jgi:hypothetical protein
MTSLEVSQEGTETRRIPCTIAIPLERYTSTPRESKLKLDKAIAFYSGVISNDTEGTKERVAASKEVSKEEIGGDVFE